MAQFKPSKKSKPKSAPGVTVSHQNRHTEAVVDERKRRHYARCNVKGGRRASTRRAQ